jgi:hypothetical protein
VDDDQATAIHPPLPDDFADYPQQPSQQQPKPQQPPPPPPHAQPPAPLQARLAGLPPEATTEEFPLVPAEPPQAAPAQQRPPQATQQVGPATQRHLPPAMESTQAHAGPYVDDDYEDDDFPAGGVATAESDDRGFPGHDDYDDEDQADAPRSQRVDSFADDDEHADDAPGGREWFLMAAQVGAGAVAGAAVWLAFSWLWGIQPVVAVPAAIIVIVGLVLGVRRWRRADDMQTTVLAILAGLVVTVSPAALLLLHR